MKSRTIDTVPAPPRDETSQLEILQMTKPEATGRAEMLEGSPEEVASKVADVLSARGLV